MLGLGQDGQTFYAVNQVILETSITCVNLRAFTIACHELTCSYSIDLPCPNRLEVSKKVKLIVVASEALKWRVFKVWQLRDQNQGLQQGHHRFEKLHCTTPGYHHMTKISTFDEYQEFPVHIVIARGLRRSKNKALSIKSF